jgi:CDP-glycerol glycerophosphotransferase (TagB/SpsB family)
MLIKVIQTLGVDVVVSVMRFLLPGKNIAIISGRNARTFSDNPKCLFNYFLAQGVEKLGFDFYFFTKNKQLYNKLSKEYEGHVLYAYHLRTFFLFCRARYFLFSHGTADFFPYKAKPFKGRRVINLFHAIPLKKVGITNYNAGKEADREMKRYTDFLVSSEEEKNNLAVEGGIPASIMRVTGIPRNDLLFNGIQSDLFNKFTRELEGRKAILYAPTFRDDGSPVSLFPFPDRDLEALDKFLDEIGARIFIRCHIDEFEHAKRNGFDFRNILFSGQDQYPDVQEILGAVDIVITDYSSICLDFLILDRPMIFLPYDYEEYNRVRGFLFEYYNATVGPKPSTQTEFITAIQHSVEDPGKDSAQRKLQLQRFHAFRDGRSCERVTQLVNSSFQE